ncbi:MAG TPA: sensor histidine kinase [Ktedonobacteraceae bacterium]|nr:sensor histidine kinase [Ktedonobacteraceae bacterium]
MENVQGNPLQTSKPAGFEGRSPFLIWVIWVVWLPLMLPGILQLFQHGYPAAHNIEVGVGLVLFFSIYLWASWLRANHLVAGDPPSKRTEQRTWVTVVVLTAISFVLSFLAGGQWLQLMYYTSGFVGGSLTLRRAILVALGFSLLIITFGWLLGLDWLTNLQSLVFVTAIVFITRSVVWSITTSWELRAAREEIARLAVMTERLRIARDLHDLLGHNLSLIALKSELAGRLIAIAPERALSEIGDVEQVARTTLQEVREAVSNYRQPTLISELHAAQEILFAAGIAYRYEGEEGVLDSLPSSVEILLSWAVREGVTNVIRHSRADWCSVHIKRQGDSVSVVVIDDGVALPGSSPATGTSTTGKPGSGNGLRGLAERVEALKGTFEAGPNLGGGYQLAVSVPVGSLPKTEQKLESLP